MIFNSLPYFLFLPVVFTLFYAVPDSVRWVVLLAASLFFYGWLLKPVLLLALGIVILVTFFTGRLIDRSTERAARGRYLWLGVAANIGLLVYFKYLPFLAQNLNLLFGKLGLDLALAQPSPLASIGLSFFIFQAISYLADIYFKMVKPEPHLGYFALYLSFFAKLLQGPIERAGDLIPQLKARCEFNYDNVRFGMVLFTWGLFKKVVVADRIGLSVDAVFGNLHAYSGLTLLVTAYAYAVQIYMDFSGYTDMALGTARLFNVKLTNNFNSPYLATSVADYWRRWHITLSRWILDYIFEPLQMKFRTWGKAGTAAALLTAFLASGIWHGASWGYIVWGLIHGVYLAASTYYRPYQKKLHKYLKVEKTRLLRCWQILVTFNLVSFALIFFRAGSLSDALYFVSHLWRGATGLASAFWVPQGDAGVVSLLFGLVLVYLLRPGPEVRVLRMPVPMRWFMYYVLVISAFIFQVSGANFIYFQF